jgi:hypothetical protein
MKKKLLSLALALALTMALASIASAAEVQRHEVPVTLTVVNTAQKISVTVPASLPVSVVDGVVVTASNAVIKNTASSGAVKIAAVTVKSGSYAIGNYNEFSAVTGSIALSINGCGTKGPGPLDLTGDGFPSIQAGSSLPILYQAKVAASGETRSVTAATVVFTIAAAD